MSLVASEFKMQGLHFFIFSKTLMNASAGNLGQPEALYWTGQTGTLGFKVHHLIFKWNKVGHPALLEC